MFSIASGPAAVDRQSVELETVLRSALFVRSPTLAHLLSYLCQKVFAGEGDQIKEYSIAVEVFGRPDTFDQDADSIVRVQANRLRKRLAEYYSGEGASHALQIVIPVGQYVPVFKENREQTSLEQPEITTTEAPRTQPARTRNIWWPLIRVSVLVVVVLGIVLFRQKPRPRTAESPRPQPAPVAQVPAGLPVGDEVRILAGGARNLVDRSGKVWTADAYFSGGIGVRSTAAHIWRTQDPAIYRTSRQGDFSYNIPLKPGIYELHLHFAETFYGPENVGGGGEGSRIMNVTANGNPLLTRYDVLADVGGGRTADVRVFTYIAPDKNGALHLNFSSVEGGRAMVSGIELLPGMQGRLRPVRIVARDMPYYSDDSRWWSADTYFKGGRLRATEETATGTDEPEFYASERWGQFSYAVPVSPGKYRLTLYFIEHGPSANHDASSPESVTGTRVFDVFCNRKLLLHNLNLAKEAGRSHALVKKFSGLEPNAQGKLLLEFVPSHGYATVSAIEVVPE